MAVVPGSGPPGGRVPTEIIVASLHFPALPKYPKIRPLPPTRREPVAALEQPCRHAEESDHAAPSPGQGHTPWLVRREISFMSRSDGYHGQRQATTASNHCDERGARP
jgi:hypothetical protein